MIFFNANVSQSFSHICFYFQNISVSCPIPSRATFSGRGRLLSVCYKCVVGLSLFVCELSVL